MLVPVLGIYYLTTRSTTCLQTSGGKTLNYHLPRFLVPYFKDYVAIRASKGKILIESQKKGSIEVTDAVHKVFL